MMPDFSLRLAPSLIHGIGVFAARDIPKGQRVYGDAFPKLYLLSITDVPPEIACRHPSIATSGRLAYPDVRFQAYMNHSDTPNYDAKEDIALTDIKEGEEITEDYRKIEGYAQVYPWLDVVK